MLEKEKLVPNVDITTMDGAKKKLWDFRQKTHVLLLTGDTDAVRAMTAKLAERRKTL